MQGRIAIWSFAGFVAAVMLAGCGGGGAGGASAVAPPIISTTPSPPAGTVNVAYAGFTFAVASGGAGPFSWSETGTLPPGLSFSSSGQLSGVPATAGTYPISVTVSDSSKRQLTATESISLVIADPSIAIVTATTPPGGTLSYEYPGFQFTANGGSPPFVWSATGTLPPGLALSPDGVLSGTPTSAGTWTFTVVAKDSAQTPMTGSQSFTVIIASPTTLAIDPPPAPPEGVHGTPYPGFSFSATGGQQPLHWTGTGAMPPGLSVSSDGILSGTPTSGGSFTFTVTVTDSASAPSTASVHFTVVIKEPLPPSIAAAPLPTGTVGVAYPAYRFFASDGLAPLVWSETGTLAGLEFSLDGVLSGTPVDAGHFPITVHVKDALNQAAVPVPMTIRVSLNRPAGAFTPTGSMSVARSGHTATRLPDGRVLVAGGPNASAELYDPASAVFTSTGSMTVARSGHTATLLANAALPNHGKVLIVGGDAAGISAELYDPASGTFTTTGSMLTARRFHTATLLASGKVLVAGGGTATAELYDPANGTFAATGSMTVARGQHTATRLLDGTVLVAGDGTTAELYDPVRGTFTATGDMSEARADATATRLQDGTVLIAGPLNTAELFDPATQTFAPVGNLLHRTFGATASLRNDGTVLVAGGGPKVLVYKQSCHINSCSYVVDGVSLVSLTSADLFAPESQGFTITGLLGTARDGHTATLLEDGAVLITGGTQHKAVTGPGFPRRPQRVPPVVLSSAELYK